jgi:hypothetical protein
MEQDHHGILLGSVVSPRQMHNIGALEVADEDCLLAAAPIFFLRTSDGSRTDYRRQ